MFWRLFLTYLILVFTAVGLVGVVALRQSEGEDIFYQLSRAVLTTAVVIALLSIVPSYILARRFTHPLNELAEGAKRLADGDLGLRIHTAGGQEFVALARSFNDMSKKLAGSFALLAHDREQLRTILSGMVEGVVAFDSEQQVLFANERAGVLLGFDPDAAIGRKLWEVARQRAVQEIVEKALGGGGPHREELDCKGPDARRLAAYVSRLPGAESAGAVMVLHDITDLRRLERLRQDFVANVSHELKTPLAVIQSNIEALQDGAAEDPQARGPFLERVKHEADRLDALIQDLLRLAKIESGEQPFELGRVPLDAAIAECLERQATRAEAKSMALIEVPPKNAPKGVAAFADEDAMEAILDNLVDNAIKYTPSGGKITVRWTATDRHVQIEVEDTGIGISEADLSRVFERFYRADRARNRAAGGTGLGLAIVKHLVQSLHGQVTVASQLGKGTTFKVTLPRAA
ncbi:HAMP domain-containing sensor histidine kinase [Limnoglobus roseus]|uniref:histidine kinase n=1 Tax=Limnoglobus roseus TaxID=2598579 RepID=A0A5C1A7H2_9BACT|nr:HAMP domain-containing sensor histidine kinase [Limnoglobus roseus]QEL13178.1 PAS domain-containing sensor histidine kinase [Limnoglobus roseus]